MSGRGRAGRRLADEVASDTFLVAWRRLTEVPEPALPWLLGVARNVLLEQYRAAARQQSLTAELHTWTSAADLTAGDIADEVAERLSVLHALARLPEADQEVLTLVAWHGLSTHEAARVVGCSAATYFVRLHRARRRLERAMDPPADEPSARAEHLHAALIPTDTLAKTAEELSR